MTPMEFDHQLRRRLLNFRWSLNRQAGSMNHSANGLGKALVANAKSQLKLQASTARLQRCMELNGL